MKFFLIAVLPIVFLTPTSAAEAPITPSAPKESDAAFCKQNCPDSCYIVCGGAPQCGPSKDAFSELAKPQGICGDALILQDGKLFGLHTFR
jgi:hypothetical protein